MKKILIIIIGFIALTVFLDKEEKELIIPKEAIRFRVIANSDKEADQQVKTLVRDNIQTHLYNDLKETSNLSEAKQVLESRIPHYDELVSNTLKNNMTDQKYTMNYGLNYFPEKIYKGVTYPEGYYDSLVVTLGNGKGNNWWCVLFPPLCLLEAEETEEKTEVEYKFFIKEIIDKYF